MLRSLVAEADENVPLYRVETLDEAVSRQLAPTRFYLYLLSTFAILAAVLAAIGLYGVVSYHTGQKTREFGLRAAFGAGRTTIMREVLFSGIAPAGAGLAIGLTIAWFAGALLESLLFEVKPQDPWVFLATATLLVVVATLASLLPAWRASRISPATALRDE